MLKTRHSKPAYPRMCPHARRRTVCTATGAASAVNYQYDANGAMTNDGLRRYEFDAAGRLANVTTGAGVDAPTTRYVHNALGQRLFKTEPQFAPVSSGSNPADPDVMQALIDFFGSLWGSSPTSTSTASTVAAPTAGDKLGFQYYYDEDGSLLYEQGTGGAQSTGSAHYVYLPTPAGPMPIATYTGSKHYAVHTDHLNTPRRLTQSNKQVAWQWAFSAFGDEQPTTAKNRFVDPSTTPNAGSTTVADVTFNLRYPGQYFDKESNLHFNYFRSYDARTGRYTQADPIDLQGGWNKYGYVGGNPLGYIDPTGESALGGLLLGAGLGVGLELGVQAFKNYSNDCDLLDVDNYNWYDVGISAAVGTIAPGWWTVGKTGASSGKAIKVLSEQLERARTLNRAGKVASRIQGHQAEIVGVLAPQLVFQGVKELGKDVSDAGGANKCGCRK
jgi:RHS repeat-associated protein